MGEDEATLSIVAELARHSLLVFGFNHTSYQSAGAT